MGEGFKSLSEFLSAAKKVERQAVETALTTGAEEEVQKILNEASVRLSVLNNPSSEKMVGNSTASVIQQGVKESVQFNTTRVKSILLDELFTNGSIDDEREQMWVNKLSDLFAIPVEFSDEQKVALIDKHLAEDEDTLNYITFLIEKSENKK